MRSYLMLGAAVVAMTVASGARAQSPASDAGPVAEPVVGLDEIVVTAQKRSENLQTVPIAITAMSGEALQSKGIENISDLGPAIPNVVVSGASSVGNAAASFFIRGIGLERSTLGMEAGVGLYIDDVYYGRSAGGFLNLLDMAQIEVLRGPQGTLFGKNTIGGAIRYVTKDATFEQGGAFDLSVGQRERLHVRGSLNVPISDTLAVKLSAGSFNSGGYVKSLQEPGIEFGDEHTNVVRAQFKWLPSDRLTVTGSADFTNAYNNGAAQATIFIDPRAPQAAEWNRRNPTTPYDARYATSLYESYRNVNKYRMDGFGLNLTARYDFSDTFAVKYIGGYRENKVSFGGDDDGSPLDLIERLFNQELPSLSQEVQFIGSAWAGRVEYVGGLYYFWEGPKERSERNIFVELPGNYGLEELDSKSYAAYGQATAELMPGLKLTLGGRFTHDVKSIEVARPLQGLYGENSGSFDNFSPKATLAYQWAPNIMTYASVSKGYRAGGFNNFIDLNDRSHNGILPFGTEVATSYEIGLKSTLFDNRLKFNVAVFDNAYSDLQLTSNNGTILVIQNIGEAQIKGVEVEAEVAVVRGLTIGANFGYLDATYTDVGNSTAVFVGSQMAGSPEYSYSLNAAYVWDLDDGAEFSIRADYGWKSEILSFANWYNAVEVPATGFLNAQVRYTFPDGRTSLSLQGRNISDERTFTTGFNSSVIRPGNYGYLMVSPTRPAEYYLTLSTKF